MTSVHGTVARSSGYHRHHRRARKPERRTILVRLASPFAGRDGAGEAAADCVQKRLVAERAADRPAPPQRGEGRVVRVPRRDDRRSAALG